MHFFATVGIMIKSWPQLIQNKKVETGGSAAYTGAPNLKVRQPISDNKRGLSITGFTGCNHMQAKWMQNQVSTSSDHANEHLKQKTAKFSAH